MKFASQISTSLKIFGLPSLMNFQYIRATVAKTDYATLGQFLLLWKQITQHWDSSYCCENRLRDTWAVLTVTKTDYATLGRFQRSRN